MSGRIRRAFTLTPAELHLLIRAFLALAMMDVRLRVNGFQPTLARVERMPRHKPVTAAEFARAQRYARWIAVAARFHVVPARCLHRSLTLHGWLRREGLQSELRIGVRQANEQLLAHAWVELDGRPADELPERTALFTPLAHADGSLPGWVSQHP